MQTKAVKKPRKVSITVRIENDLFKYLEAQRRGLRDRTGQIEFFIRYHQAQVALVQLKDKIKKA